MTPAPLTDKPFPGREWRLDAGLPARPSDSIARVYLVQGRLFHLAATGAVSFDQLASAAASCSSRSVHGHRPRTREVMPAA